MYLVSCFAMQFLEDVTLISTMVYLRETKTFPMQYCVGLETDVLAMN
jgi:hypothetical protein